MIYTEIIGYIAGILVFISLLPQTIKSLKTKSTKDLSLWRYIIYIMGLTLWIIYGISIKSGPVITLNCLSFILASVILSLKIRYG
jgi:MtN3 and saliva related transmembrane protein